MSDAIAALSSPTTRSTAAAASQQGPNEADRRCTLYTNLILLTIAIAFLLSDERDIFSIFRNGLFVRDALLDDDVLDVKKTYHLLPQGKDGTAAEEAMPGRFPRLGSKEFRKECSWTSMHASAYRNCTVYMTPRPEGHEVSKNMKKNIYDDRNSDSFPA